MTRFCATTKGTFRSAAVEMQPSLAVAGSFGSTGAENDQRSVMDTGDRRRYRSLATQNEDGGVARFESDLELR